MTPKFDEKGLIPAIIQDEITGKVLMLGYMNEEAVQLTKDTGKVTFFSRSKDRIWVKGESSGNHLTLVDMKLDCDSDTYLIKVNPNGPTCHTGTDTCWGTKNEDEAFRFLNKLEAIIDSRRKEDSDKSYVASLFRKGINKIAQKVGEEAVEIVIEAKDNNEELFLNEGADLLFHYLILLQAKGYALKDIIKVLEGRHR